MARTWLKRWWKSRPSRFARATVAAVVLAWATYVVLINVFLSTSLFERIVDNDPVTLDIHYARAWSLWPGRLHARGLSIRASDNNIEWILELDTVRFDVSFVALVQRRFEVDRVRGDGIAMRIRRKLSRGPQHVADIADLPPIAGFPAYSMAPAGPHGLELWDDKHYHLITVRLEHVVATNVRELWIDDVRFRGRAEVSGRFYLKPLRAVDVGPCRATIATGELTRGRSHLVAEDLGGTLAVKADRFDPRRVHGNQLLRYFDVATDLHATANDLAKMPFGYPIYVSGVVKASRIGIRVEHGVLAPGTELIVSTPELLAAKDDVIGRATLDLHAIVDAERRLRVDVRLADGEVVRPDSSELLRVDTIGVHGDAAKLDLADGTPFGDVHVASEITNAIVADASRSNYVLPDGIRIRSGSATLNGRVEVWPHERRATASAGLRYHDVAFATRDLALRGSGDLAASLDALRWDDGGVRDLEGVNLRDALTATTVAKRDLRATVDEGTLTFRLPHAPVGDPAAALEATFALDDAALDVAAGKIAARGHVDVSGAIRVEKKKLASLDADVRARATSLRGDFGGARAAATDVAGTAHVTRRDAIMSGRASLDGEVAFTTGRLTTGGHARVALDLDALDRHRLTVGGSKVALTKAKGSVAGEPAFTAERIAVDGRTRALDLEAPDLESLDAHIDLTNVALTNAAALQPLLSPKSKLRLTSGAAVANGRLDVAGERGASGDVEVVVTRAGFAVGKAALVADATLTAKVNGLDPDASTIDLSGSRLALRNVDVTSSSAATRGWSGGLDFDATKFSWADGTPALGSGFLLTARDAKPVLGMLLRGHAPKVLANLATMPDLALRGRLALDPDAIVLSDVYAHGGDVAFRGSYAVRDGNKSGAFVVSKAGVAVGLRLANDGAHPRFFGLDSWLNAEEKKVKTAPKSDARGAKGAESP